MRKCLPPSKEFNNTLKLLFLILAKYTIISIQAAIASLLGFMEETSPTAISTTWHIITVLP